MKILLLHPEDDFQRSWVRERWDLVVDLGKAPKSSYDDWSRQLGCPVFSIFDLAIEVEDLLAWRDLLRLGIGRVVDRFGIDWWDVIGILLQPEMQDLRLVQRLANKIGTYTVAILAKEHGLPFYVAAPISTVDLACADGSGIPIEQRNAREITHIAGKQMVPDGVEVENPAFDVTPAKYVAAIITEKGIARAPYEEALRRLAGLEAEVHP